MQNYRLNALKMAFFSTVAIGFCAPSVIAQTAIIAPTVAVAKVATDAEIDLIMEERYCSGCHDMTKKMVGPSFNDITKKYAEGDKKTNIDKLSTAIRNGGKGVWGATAMPANATVTDSELQAIATWLVSRTLK